MSFRRSSAASSSPETPADEAAWAAGSWHAVPASTVTGPAADTAEQLTRYAGEGITEIVYQPSGPDLTGELERFIAVTQNPEHPAETIYASPPVGLSALSCRAADV